jgi:dihydrofolate reductase
MSRIEIHGYAIVSDDDRIADETGRTPDVLRNDADWAYFQAELNRSDVTVLGRLGHEANPNPRGRMRMILSSSSPGIERRADGWWWNPQKLTWEQAIRTILPHGGRIAVPGGRQVFDLFLAIGYDAFHLTRAEGVVVPKGVPVFSACDSGKSAETVLSEAGLEPGARRILDRSGPISLAVWRR